MKKTMLTLLALVLAMMFSISAYAENPAAISKISSVADVPLITLNNGVQVPQLGLGTQIQSLERRATVKHIFNTGNLSAVDSRKVHACKSAASAEHTSHGLNV